MVEVTIYGASDDLIEVEGDVSLEFPCDGSGTLAVIGAHGEIAEVSVSLDEWWEASASLVRYPHMIRAESVVRPGRAEDSEDMALRIVLDGDEPPLVYQAER